MTGYSSEDAIGKTPRILQGPNSNREELAKLSRSLKKFEPYEMTTINYKKSGEEFWINFTVTPVANEQGRYTHYIATERDVTEKITKELEKELTDKIGEIFNQNIDNDTVECLSSVCQQIAKFGDFDFSEIWLPAIDTKTINLVTNYSQSKAGNIFYDKAKDLDSYVLGETFTGYVWKNEKTEIIGDEDENWRLFKRGVFAKKAGIKAIMSVPLKHKKEVIGVLLLGTKKTKSDLVLYLPLFQKLELTIGAQLSRKKVETELAQIFNFIPDMICVADFDGYIKRMNTAGLEILGYSLEEICSRPLISFIHEEDRLQTQEKLTGLFKGESVQKFENRYITKEGKIVWLSWTANRVLEHGMIYAVAKNITEEKKLRELNSEVGRLLKIGGWEFDIVNETLYWSNEVHQLHKTDPNSFLPSLDTAINFYRADFRQTVSLNLEECIKTGESFDFEAIIVTAEKKELWVRAYGNSEFVDGKCKRLYGSFQDIHERKLAAIELEKSLNALRDYKFSLDQSAIISFTDKKGVIISVNDNFCNISKYKREEIVGKTHRIINSHYHSKEVFSDLWKTIASGNVWRGELKNKKKDGSYFWADTTIVPFLDKKKKPTRYLAIRFDITERKKSEQIVIKSNERFEKVTEATNDTIWDWDIVQKTFYRSKAIEKSFKPEVSKLLTPIDVVKFTSAYAQWKKNIHPDDRKKTQNSLDDAIADPLCNRWEQEYRIINYQEEIIYVIDRSVIIRDEDGKAIRMVGAMTDTSEQKQLDLKLSDVNEALQRHMIELERSNEELEQFAFVASHDLQEPLRMVSSFMDLLKRKYGDQFDEKGHQYIHFATDGAKKMKQIILDLLDYSRAGKVIEEPITFDLNKTLEEYKILRRKIIEEKKVIILNDSLPLVTTFKVPLTQAIHSILDNAIKYSKEGVQPKIEICVKENDKEWIIEVKDNGIGIDKHFFKKIFIIFQRLHDKDKYEGTGIGLSIAKKNIESCNGKIWVESTVNKGSTFSFTINKIKS
jgi:PAS domain S-box-containing protein